MARHCSGHLAFKLECEICNLRQTSLSDGAGSSLRMGCSLFRHASVTFSFWRRRHASSPSHCSGNFDLKVEEFRNPSWVLTACNVGNEPPAQILSKANRILSHRLALCSSSRLAMAWQRSGNLL
jgi:hypothetical protein